MTRTHLLRRTQVLGFEVRRVPDEDDELDCRPLLPELEAELPKLETTPLPESIRSN